MKSRLIATVALGIALALGTSGCSLISTQATRIDYAAAEGTNVPVASGPLQVRNALIVANDEGTEGNFVAAIINDTDETYVLHLEFPQGTKEEIIVAARTVKSLGTEDTAPLLIRDLGAKPGSDAMVSFQSGDGITALMAVPVLNGDLSYLAPLVP